MSLLTTRDLVLASNPLDILEDIVTANEWLFERANDDELIVELAGRWCHYRMFFVWQREIGALQFSCQFDMKVPEAKRSDVNDLLGTLNNRLWLGHFDLELQQLTPLFATPSSRAANACRRLRCWRIWSKSRSLNASGSIPRSSSSSGAANALPRPWPPR